MYRPPLFTNLLILLVFVTNLSVASAELRYQTIEGHGGVLLNVASTGDPDKPSVLLIHGIGQSHVSFEAQLSAPLTDLTKV